MVVEVGRTRDKNVNMYIPAGDLMRAFSEQQHVNGRWCYPALLCADEKCDTQK